MKKQYREDKKTATEVMWERQERERHTALWAGVVFFMVLIAFLWALNTKNLLEYFNFNKKKSFNIDQFSVEFNESLSQFKDQVSEMENQPVPKDFKPQVPQRQTDKK